ncbi:S24 family peptidase [Novosphingobium olei]|uniref:Transcriptional regulator n=1 Tax=Novosphingobium olei TaxID=2728851 RepID=A0A7Y0BLN2_9SPHN|nr:S24 family peptidase [Novosphingobium olei]NML92741.1 transcriptional regulator [Novosphingobium olei]
MARFGESPDLAAENSIDGPRGRLLELANARNVSLSALSALIGRNTTYLQQFVRKGSPRKLEENDRRTLAEFFGVDESELGAPARGGVVVVDLPGVAPLQPARQVARTAERPIPAALAEWADIPRLPLGASAGPGAMAGEEIPSGRLRFNNRWLKGQGLEPANLSVIEVEGDSMEPTLRDGDEILVDRSPRPMRAGVHVIRLDDVLLVKRLETGPAGTIRVISDNPAYPRMERPVAEVEIVGRVVWKGGRL